MLRRRSAPRRGPRKAAAGSVRLRAGRDANEVTSPRRLHYGSHAEPRTSSTLALVDVFRHERASQSARCTLLDFLTPSAVSPLR